MTPVVLSLDTSTGATAAAVLREGACVERREEAVAGGRPAHSPALLALASEALGEVGVGFGEVSTVAVGIGPGSFTGLRVGIAAASGLAAGLEADLVGVGSLRALAHGSGVDCRVLALIDARRGELFASIREPGCEPGQPFTVPAPEVGGLVSSGTLCIGDGAILARTALEAAGGEVPSDGDERHKVLASVIAELARTPDCAGPEVLPRYVRPPDAVPTADR